MKYNSLAGPAILAGLLSFATAHAVPTPQCVADLTGDTIVNGADLFVLLGQWGPYTCPPYKPADFNHNCKVDGPDLAFLLGSWMACDPIGLVVDPTLPAGTWSRPFTKLTPSLYVNIQGAGTQFTVTSHEFGVLRTPTPQAFYDAAGPLTVQAQMIPTSTGFDIQYVITNPTSTSQPLPNLQVCGLQLPASMTHLTLPFGTHFEPLTWQLGTAAISEQNPYPTTRYAPVAVMKNDSLAVGISLEYPVLEYRHAVSPQFRRYALDTSWRAWVVLDGQIGPGESRQYRLTTRFAHALDWIRTLKPYRDYLWDKYGNLARYPQDLRPFWGRTEAHQEFINPTTNPRGFQSTHWPDGFVWRIDLNGWKREVDYIVNYIQSSGYERMLMVVPSGLHSYTVDRTFAQFPSQIMTQWLNPMITSQNELLRIADAGADLGYWWGNSVWVAYVWDPPALEALDPTNPVHVQWADNQVNLAVSRGAKTIGLDSYRMMDLWKSVPWLAHLQSIAPQVQFASEPNCNDILHMMIPIATHYSNVPTAPLLADYLVPGRAIWVMLDNEVSTLEQAARYIGWGMSVVSFSQSLTANQMAPLVQMAQHGWVLDPDQPPPAAPPQ